MPPATPYWRLSAFYLCYFASLGALMPYWGLYLQDHGHDALAIGELMALLMATKVVAPNVWAAIADRRGRRMGLVRVAALAGAASFTGVLADDSFAWLALVTVVFGFFWNASLPQLEATTLNHLGNDPQRYSRIRVWGSIGFILSVVGLGALFQTFGRDWLPWSVLVLFLGIWSVSLAVPEAGHPAAGHAAAEPPGGRVVLRPAVLALLALSLLMQASHGPYYSFFSIHLDAVGYRSDTIGVLWALGVVAEVGVFLLAHRLLYRIPARRLLIASLLLTALRWLLIAFLVDSLPWLLFAQVLHAASFGVCHAAAIDLVHRLFPPSHQGRGQALYSSVSFGAGGALGSLLGGYAWGAYGATVTFTLAALVALAGLAVTVLWLPSIDRGWTEPASHRHSRAAG